MGKTNVFQWENWQLHGSIRIPTWYLITMDQEGQEKQESTSFLNSKRLT